MPNHTQEFTQLERFLNRLQDIKSDITPFDRLDCQDKCGYSPATISNYLNGKGADLDTAVKMLTFFRQRIDQREKLINP